MAVQITIIGLGQVGSSMGLALAGQKNIKRIGHDKDYEVARRAQKNGVVDEIKFNLPASVSAAQVVILSLPLSEIRETLGYIAQDLQEGTVILDTAPAKGTVAAWFSELVPAGRHYVGLTPAVGGVHLQGTDTGMESAHADFFAKGMFLVNAPHGTPGEAVKLATDLVELLGATAMISDALEADGLMASAHLLPQLASAALVDATVNQPGWMEARKVAARPYANVTAAAAQDEARSLSAAALSNRESVLRVLDGYLNSLANLRDIIAGGDEKAITDYVEHTNTARTRWVAERLIADWQGLENAEVKQSFGDKLSHMFLGNMLEKNKKKK